MKKLVLIIAAVFGMAVAANAANYKVDDSAIDALIENAEEVMILDVAEAAPVAANLPAVSQKSVQPAVALVLSFIVGGFGIHRHYMGTAPGMWALYTFVDNDISRYINNRKFFMWA